MGGYLCQGWGCTPFQNVNSSKSLITRRPETVGRQRNGGGGGSYFVKGPDPVILALFARVRINAALIVWERG